MSKPAKRYVLGREEINVIIEIWKENIAELRGVHRNVHIYSSMCKEAEKYGIFLTPVMMRTRINNLSKAYRAERTKQSKSGGIPSEWAYYSAVDSILGEFKSSYYNKQMDKSAKPCLVDELDIKLEAEEDELGTPAASQSSSSADTSPSPEFASIPAPSANTSNRKRKANSEILEIMKEDQTIMKHFLTKTLENDQKTIELLQENNKLLSKFLKK